MADLRRAIVVRDREGLHARPCAAVARVVQKYGCVVTARFDGRGADASSVFELLGLLAPGGAAIEFHAVGVDAAACLDAVDSALSAVS